MTGMRVFGWFDIPMITGDSQNPEKGWEVIPEAHLLDKSLLDPLEVGPAVKPCLPQLRVRFALTN